jgi:hypothetical protein
MKIRAMMIVKKEIKNDRAAPMPCFPHGKEFRYVKYVIVRVLLAGPLFVMI